MSDNLMTGVVTVALGVISVATLAVIFSPNAQTANVFTAGGNALANNIKAAEGPVLGTGSALSLPSSPSSY